MQNPSSSSGGSGAGGGVTNVPLLQRLLHMKSKVEADSAIDRESIVKEPLLPRSVIPEESEIFMSTDQTEGAVTETATTSSTSTDAASGTLMVRSPTAISSELENGASRKPWAMLKDASIKTEGRPLQHHRRRASPARRVQVRQSLVHLRQKTKMYASVDDLSPEYCGLPFVKKLKILNERQKLAELEKAVRSSSLDCGENAEAEFDGNLTRSHSEACAIEYARKLAKLNKVKSSALPMSTVRFVR